MKKLILKEYNLLSKSFKAVQINEDRVRNYRLFLKDLDIKDLIKNGYDIINLSSKELNGLNYKKDNITFI